MSGDSDSAGLLPSGHEPAESHTGAPHEKEDAAALLCEYCGADKPAAVVHSCTLCMMNFCTTHLNPAAHDCSHGAFGKPHSVGIGGSG